MIERRTAPHILILCTPQDRVFGAALETQLAAIRQGTDLTFWDESQTIAGAEHRAELLAQVDKADIVMALVSPDFLQNAAYNDELLPRLEQRGIALVPVLVRPSQWERHPRLGPRAVLPQNKRAVTAWTNHDEAWSAIADGIAELIRQWNPDMRVVTRWPTLHTATFGTAINSLDDVVLFMHPEAKRQWQSALQRAVEPPSYTIETPEHAWHRVGPPDMATWAAVYQRVLDSVAAVKATKAQRIHVVANAPYSLGALIGDLLEPHNHPMLVWQHDNMGGGPDQKKWRPWGPTWWFDVPKKASFFKLPIELSGIVRNEPPHIAVVVNITGNGAAKHCCDEVQRYTGEPSVPAIMLQPEVTGQNAIPTPTDADAAATDLDKRLREIAELHPNSTLHLFYYGPLAVLIRGAGRLHLRRVPIIVWEAMQFGATWRPVPAVAFPEGRLLIGQGGVDSGVGG